MSPRLWGMMWGARICGVARRVANAPGPSGLPCWRAILPNQCGRPASSPSTPSTDINDSTLRMIIAARQDALRKAGHPSCHMSTLSMPPSCRRTINHLVGEGDGTSTTTRPRREDRRQDDRQACICAAEKSALRGYGERGRGTVEDKRTLYRSTYAHAANQ
jgi:hypothetical protein